MNQNPKIKIVITGDLCPHNRIEKLTINSEYKAVFNDFIDVFKGNDLNVTDLECPLTSLDKGRIKTGPHQKADPRCIELLKFASIKLAALANNHIMDYGSQGAKDTIELCHKNNIASMGVGENAVAARRPFIIRIKEKKVAFINVADQEFLTTTDGLFQANPMDPVNVHNDIVKVKHECDYVIIIVHAGNEFYHLPSLRTKILYRFLIDAGADAVISNHTHCFSGYEVYKEKPIFYGLGNFIYDSPGKINSDWNKGYVVKLFLGECIDFEIIPLKQGNELPGVFHLNVKEDLEFRQILDERNKIIADDAKLEQAFLQYVSTVTQMYDTFIEPYFSSVYNGLRLRGFLPNLLNRRKRLLLLNLIRSESHREVLLRMLKKYE